MKAVKVAFAALVAAGLLASLVSCENFGQGPLAVKRSGSHMLIAVCTDFPVGAVNGELKTSSWSNKWTTFLDGRGSMNIHAGDIVSTRADWPGLSMSTNRDPDMREGVNIGITLSPKGSANEIAGDFAFGSGGLSSRQWLHPDGSYTKKPCAGVVSTPTASLTQG